MTDYTAERQYSLLPVNRSALEEALDLGFGRFLDRMAPPFPELMNPAETPVDFLSYLAADRGVAEWDADAPEAEKRSMVAMSWPTKRQAGTTRAIKSALKGLQLTADVTPWYKQTPRGTPYTFTLVAWVNDNRNGADVIISQSLFPRLIAAIDAAKNERTSYTMQVGALFTGGWKVANASQIRSLDRRSLAAVAVQPDDAANEIGLANASEIRSVYHYSADAVGVPIEIESPLGVANATTMRSVVRVTMEAIYL